MVAETININEFLDSSLLKLTLDVNGSILDMTEEVKILLGQNPLPRHMSDIFYQDLLLQIEERLSNNKPEMVTGHSILTGHLIGENKNLKPCYIIYQYHSGKVIITIKVGEWKKKMHQVYENIFTTSNCSMALVNEWGFLVSTNNQFTQEFPIQSSGDFVHLQEFFKQVTPVPPFSYQAYILEARTSGFAQRKMSYDVNGELRYFNVYLGLDRETEMFVLKAVDITETELLFDQLAHSDQLCTTGEIAASIAHEVRNPMTTLQGFLQLLEHEVSGNARNYVAVIQDEVKRMNEILNEMLALSKPAVDEVTIFSLTVLVEEVLVLLRPKALLDHIHLVNEMYVNEPVLIRANPNRIKQVLVNLLKNAMEAMEAKGRLTVIVEEGDMGNVNVLVKDTGVGMDEEMLQKIYLPFVSGKEGGTGLGLPFVKKTVQEYGGTISVTSEIGKGTTFQLSFPKISLAESV
ncbi:nitrogen regulation protein NR(II) [Sporosarcina sp. P33]|uniref:two-component system sensor histidine kinase NtrB n=1 Tax=Sporosarcina sp. P33 TaxID=1930764 RepID=UPI0009BCAACB|nr:HAMP domain-containing sensor histidine kinase [Sporosarcina sp. P33]ARD49140.1 hypothetical protein SporoP33_13450 [Sporosarcina sp. P33]